MLACTIMLGLFLYAFVSFIRFLLWISAGGPDVDGLSVERRTGRDSRASPLSHGA